MNLAQVLLVLTLPVLLLDLGAYVHDGFQVWAVIARFCLWVGGVTGAAIAVPCLLIERRRRLGVGLLIGSLCVVGVSIALTALLFLRE